jgi:uncharacterized protein (TIGR02145 family)
MKRTLFSSFLMGSFFFITGCLKDDPPQPIELEAEITHVSKFGESDGSILLNLSGGSPPFSFTWSTGDTTRDLSGIPAGIYSVAVSDIISQAAADTFEVFQPELEGVMDIDGNIYSTIKIGNQTWMKENLRVTHAPDGSDILSFAYINDPDSIKKYGRLYSWHVAMNGSIEEEARGICPEGWHLPSDDEWKELEMALGMTQAEANMTNTWRESPVGTMMKAGGASGYEAHLAGRCVGGSLSLMGEMEYMWTSSQYSSSLAWRRCLDASSSAVGRWNTFPKGYCFSVRCVKDE